MKEAKIKQKPKEGEQSHYAKKRASGNMMYGPGCCAHTVTQAQVDAARRRAAADGHFTKPAFVPERRGALPIQSFNYSEI